MHLNVMFLSRTRDQHIVCRLEDVTTHGVPYVPVWSVWGESLRIPQRTTHISPLVEFSEFREYQSSETVFFIRA